MSSAAGSLKRQSHGTPTWGFGTLELHRIFAGHFANNPGSAEVLRKIGMNHEGSARGHIWKWGEFLDLEMYAMLASEVASTSI
jgi:ribosomal-protein-alanine N-acetyltransferase